MVYNPYPQDYDEGTREETWDLRQFYTRYLALFMMDFKTASDNRDYRKMLSILDRWHCFVHGRVAKKVDKNGYVIKDKVYESLRKQLVEKSNKYIPVYFGKSLNAKAVHELDLIFKEMVMYLIHNMSKNELFGKRVDISGL